MSILYCDGHAKPQVSIQAFARVTDEHGKCKMQEIEALLPELKQTTLETPLGQIRCIPVLDEKTGKQQINYAEIVGLYAALKLANHNPEIIGIYSDSQTALAWSAGRIPKHMSPEKSSICKLAYEERKKFEISQRWIKKIQGKHNLADFGHHNRSNKRLKKN